MVFRSWSCLTLQALTTEIFFWILIRFQMANQLRPFHLQWHKFFILKWSRLILPFENLTSFKWSNHSKSGHFSSL
jgi:hypothetical protein